MPEAAIESGARHPRERLDWPRVGIFAQRGEMRPNRIGVSRCRLLRVDGRRLHVEGLDAIDGTPVLDIKPYMREFGPRGGCVSQPAWATELMREYYEARQTGPLTRAELLSDDLEIVFDTVDTTRKIPNLRRNPRIALVVGWDEEQTAQIEGVADEPRGADLERLKDVYFRVYPDGVERQAWKGITYVRVRPTWARYSDFRGGGDARIVEIDLTENAR